MTDYTASLSICGLLLRYPAGSLDPAGYILCMWTSVFETQREAYYRRGHPLYNSALTAALPCTLLPSTPEVQLQTHFGDVSAPECQSVSLPCLLFNVSMTSGCSSEMTDVHQEAVCVCVWCPAGELEISSSCMYPAKVTVYTCY